jgi:hypothetical protein
MRELIAKSLVKALFDLLFETVVKLIEENAWSKL